MAPWQIILTLVAILLGALPANAQTTHYVNGTTGNDATPKASNSLSTLWRTIGRAAWGTTDRNAPNGAEAAAAGDTVLIAGGTYTTDAVGNNRWAVIYNPVNSGTPSLPITFRCVGTCVLGAPNANAPVIGSSDRDHIRWFADVGQGHSWQINAYGREAGTASATQVNTTPDTGPVVCHGGTGCFVEGANIDGGLQVDYTDNWNGIRFNNCTGCTARNNTIRNFRNLANTANGTAFTLYGSANALIEHNYIANVGSGLNFKDTATSTLPQSGVRVRYNKFDGADRCVSWSTTGEDRNYVYQNICVTAELGHLITGGGLQNDWIFNNTYYNLSGAGLYPSGNGSGGRFWNNIILNAYQIIAIDSGPMPADTVLDLEHNLYHGYTRFYGGPDGTRTFAEFGSAYPTHHQLPPVSVSADPLLVNPAGGDFRLCTAPGVPAPSCTGASPAIGLGVDIYDLDGDSNTTETIRAGAYIDNTERIGVQSGAPSAPTNLRVLEE